MAPGKGELLGGRRHSRAKLDDLGRSYALHSSMVQYTCHIFWLWTRGEEFLIRNNPTSHMHVALR